MSEERMYEWHCGICLARVVVPIPRDALKTVEDEHRLHRGEFASLKPMRIEGARVQKIRVKPC